MTDIFETTGMQSMIDRINQLTPSTQGQWGKMTVAQMLAHCSVAYEMVYSPEKYKRPNAFARFMLKLFVKNAVVGPKPYPRNGRTAPDFIVDDERVFETEKKRLIGFIQRVQQDGTTFFDQKESFSFGPLSIEEWNTLFSKHLDHHLTQFGV